MERSREQSAVIMTFNLRIATLADRENAWRYRKGRAAEAILAAEADIVGTQEGNHAMLQELTALLPGYAWIGEGRKGGGSGETNAIMYREDQWTPEESETFWLSEKPSKPGSQSWGAAYPRICTWGLFRSVQMPESRIVVCNTHLDHISGHARKQGAALVASKLQELERKTGAPAVLTGDFNAKPRSEAIESLTRVFGLLSAYDVYPGGTDGAGATFHGFRGGGSGGLPIDYIFAYGASCTWVHTVVDRERYGGMYPSDHYPVRAVVCWTR